jgi:hypothetical protein
MYSKTYDDVPDYKIWRCDHLKNAGGNRLH